MDELVNKTGRLQVDDEEEWETNESATEIVKEKYLVGCFYTTRIVTMKLVETLLGRVWIQYKGWKVKKLHQQNNKIILGISCVSMNLTTTLLGKGPWVFNVGLLLLDRWPDSGKWQDANLQKYQLWVRAVDIPIKLLTEKNIQRIGAAVGKVISATIDNLDEVILRGFVKFQVEKEIHEPLISGRFVPWEGRKAWVQFKYEKLPFICFKCGKVIHETKDCIDEMIMAKSDEDKEVQALGVWMKVGNMIRNCFEGASQRFPESQDREGQSKGDINRVVTIVSGEEDESSKTMVHGVEDVHNIRGTAVKAAGKSQDAIEYSEEISGKDWDPSHLAQSNNYILDREPLKLKLKLGQGVNTKFNEHGSHFPISGHPNNETVSRNIAQNFTGKHDGTAGIVKEIDGNISKEKIGNEIAVKKRRRNSESEDATAGTEQNEGCKILKIGEIPSPSNTLASDFHLRSTQTEVKFLEGLGRQLGEERNISKDRKRVNVNKHRSSCQQLCTEGRGTFQNESRQDFLATNGHGDRSCEQVSTSEDCNSSSTILKSAHPVEQGRREQC